MSARAVAATFCWRHSVRSGSAVRSRLPELVQERRHRTLWPHGNRSRDCSQVCDSSSGVSRVLLSTGRRLERQISRSLGIGTHKQGISSHQRIRMESAILMSTTVGTRTHLHPLAAATGPRRRHRHHDLWRDDLTLPSASASARNDDITESCRIRRTSKLSCGPCCGSSQELHCGWWNHP